MHRANKINSSQYAKSPSIRTPSETASTNEDWKTAVGDSVRGLGNEGSSPLSPDEYTSASREPLFDTLNSRTMSIRHINRLENDRFPGDMPRNEIVDEQEAERRQVTHRLSSANLRKQTAELSMEEELTTPQPNRKRQSILDSGASMISAAPSAVFDELDELKRRIQRLELGPAMSSSPHSPGFRISPHGRSKERARARRVENGPMNMVYTTPDTQRSPISPSNGHPLLRDSLRRLKSSQIDSELLKHLEMAISDALVLASQATDRLIHTRADSLCRSLTEICLLFADHPETGHRDELSGVRQEYRSSSPHSAGHHLRTYSSLPRSMSSRRNLAELLQPRDDYCESARSTSRLSRYTEAHELDAGSRHSMLTDYRTRSNTDLPHLASRRSIVPSALGHTGASHLSGRRSSGDRSHSVVGSEASTRRQTHSSGSHARTMSRASVADILDRPPVTRDSLYARYQRPSPRALMMNGHDQEDLRSSASGHSVRQADT